MERFGRRMSMLLLSFPCLIGWALIYFAANLEMIYAGRFITGYILRVKKMVRGID